MNMNCHTFQVNRDDDDDDDDGKIHRSLYYSPLGPKLDHSHTFLPLTRRTDYSLQKESCPRHALRITHALLPMTVASYDGMPLGEGPVLPWFEKLKELGVMEKICREHPFRTNETKRMTM
jgi:hypothetical protein